MGVEVSAFRAVPVGDRFGVEAEVFGGWVPVGAVGTLGQITFATKAEAETDAANRQKAMAALTPDGASVSQP